MTGLDNTDSTILFGYALACEHLLQMEMVLELFPLSSAKGSMLLMQVAWGSIPARGSRSHMPQRRWKIWMCYN